MSFLHTNITCKFNFLVLCFKNKSRYQNMEDSPPEIAYQLQKIKKETVATYKSSTWLACFKGEHQVKAVLRQLAKNMPNRAVVSSHQFDILLHFGDRLRGFRSQYQGLKTSAIGCCFPQQAATQGDVCWSLLDQAELLTSLGQCFSRAKNTVMGTVREHRGCQLQVCLSQSEVEFKLVCENHVIKSHPTSFQGRSKYLHWGYWESQLSTVCRVGTEAHTGFAPRYKINSLIKLSKEVRVFWPAQRSFPSLKGVTTEGAVVE